MKTMTLAVLLLASSARAQSTATLRGVDVYRSTVLNSEKARQLFGERLSQLVFMRNQRRAASTEKSETIRKELEREAAKLPGIAWAGLTVSEYYTSVDHALYATFDVVDETDRGRMAFLAPQKKTLPDPEGLVAAWKTYYETGSALAKRGEMPVDRPDCPGFYCLWGGPTPSSTPCRSASSPAPPRASANCAPSSPGTPTRRSARAPSSSSPTARAARRSSSPARTR
ncbi:MAG: hypothetical protein M0D55_12440 [Elusimicrobiota bacterium]|nr:MAG: hypothetical protein M0D55_12440 [Elusimicrobiota bacterium]